MTPWPIQYEKPQFFELQTIGHQNERSMNALGRKAADFLIRATRLNGGIIPDPLQIRIQRLAARHAKKAMKRK
jgi:hypothetical protein